MHIQIQKIVNPLSADLDSGEILLTRDGSSTVIKVSNLGKELLKRMTDDDSIVYLKTLGKTWGPYECR